MIKATMNLSVLDAMMADIQNTEANMFMVLAEIAAAARVLIPSKLREVIGNKAKHFTIEVVPSAFGVEILVKTKDDIGNFIFDGTKPHMISSTRPMPVGGNDFSMRVSHPGTNEYGSKIDAAAYQAVQEAVILVLATR